jgi:hypothetical protein
MCVLTSRRAARLAPPSPHARALGSAPRRGVGSESVVHTDIILIPTLYRAVRVC